VPIIVKGPIPDRPPWLVVLMPYRKALTPPDLSPNMEAIGIIVIDEEEQSGDS
jgi:hypothetical protein